MAAFDLTSRRGRIVTTLDYLWNDHAYLRLGFSNAHWISPEMARANQPWPFQLEAWARRGVKTVINLRGGFDAAFYALEKATCERLGLNLADFTMTSREPPTRVQVEGARELFESITYPAMMHCKSGADRAGVMAVLYVHFRLGQPIAEARRQLSPRYLHVRAGLTGVLDFVFERYLERIEPQGVSFLTWVRSEAYDPAALRAEFRSRWWGTLLSERLLKRE